MRHRLRNKKKEKEIDEFKIPIDRTGRLETQRDDKLSYLRDQILDEDIDFLEDWYSFAPIAQ